MSPPFIYINGYPGVGKLTVAQELKTMLQNAKLYDNHKLIDATAGIYERGAPEYQPLRQDVRQLILNAIATSPYDSNTTWIFTDAQSSSSNGRAAVNDYQRTAERRGSPFVSVILTCELQENRRRLNGPGRGGDNTKLTDESVLREIRETEDIYHMGGELELEIDVTHKSSHEVAAEIRSFLGVRGLARMGP